LELKLNYKKTLALVPSMSNDFWQVHSGLPLTIILGNDLDLPYSNRKTKVKY